MPKSSSMSPFAWPCHCMQGMPSASIGRQGVPVPLHGSYFTPGDEIHHEKVFVSITSTVAQVGNMELDHDFWGRPEDMEAAGVVRPAYMVNATHPGSDMAGMTAAGLASASLVSCLTCS